MTLPRKFDPEFIREKDGFIRIKQTCPKDGEFWIHRSDVDVFVSFLKKAASDSALSDTTQTG